MLLPPTPSCGRSGALVGFVPGVQEAQYQLSSLVPKRFHAYRMGGWGSGGEVSTHFARLRVSPSNPAGQLCLVSRCQQRKGWRELLSVSASGWLGRVLSPGFGDTPHALCPWRGRVLSLCDSGCCWGFRTPPPPAGWVMGRAGKYFEEREGAGVAKGRVTPTRRAGPWEEAKVRRPNQSPG